MGARACLFTNRYLKLMLRINVMHLTTIQSETYFQFNLIYLDTRWANCRFSLMVANYNTIIKCLLGLADLALIEQLIF